MKNVNWKLKTIFTLIFTSTSLVTSAAEIAPRKRVVNFVGNAFLSIPSIGTRGGSWFTYPTNLGESGAYTCSITISNPSEKTQEISKDDGLQFFGLRTKSATAKKLWVNPTNSNAEKIIIFKEGADPVACMGGDIATKAECRKIPSHGIMVAMVRLYAPLTGVGHVVSMPCHGVIRVNNETNDSNVVLDGNAVGILMASGSVSYAGDLSAKMYATSDATDSSQKCSFSGSVKGFQTGTTSFDINGGRPF